MSEKQGSFEGFLDQVLEDPQFAAALLSDALRVEDLDVFLLTLRDIIRVHGSVAAIAERANISRSTLYSMFGEYSNPSFKTLLSVLHATGYDVTITRRRRTQKRLSA